MHIATLMLLGSGELGREFAIAAKRHGAKVVACDRYEGAPAMQVADACETVSMLDGAALRAAVEKHRPDVIVPEIEAIDTDTLVALEAEGWRVTPCAGAARATMNRDNIRSLAAEELGLETSKYRFAENEEDAVAAAGHTGYPCIVKPVMSSSGKGQSMARDETELRAAWSYAVDNMRGDRPRVIVEEYIRFDYEITLLTVAHAGGIAYCPPIGHVQEGGDYRTSWQPAAMSDAALGSAREQAAKVVAALGGHGLFGVEFFIAGDRAIFSELSPRPHDTGMATLIGPGPNEFELHLFAILGLPVPDLDVLEGGRASAVILADEESDAYRVEGLADALACGAPGTPVAVRLFSKPTTRPGRRMGVALAAAGDPDAARALAEQAASKVKVI